MKINFDTTEAFIKEYNTYHLDKCDVCNEIQELQSDDVTVYIEDRLLHFPQLLVLNCTKCDNKCLPMHTKKMIHGAYQRMLEENQYTGEFISKGYIQKFKYCEKVDYIYDHKDFYNIPGLCFDDEHSIEGFLTPVFFNKNALIYFIAMPDYEVEIFSESYGALKKIDESRNFSYEWSIPFGFNSNNNLVFWLGDLDYIDDSSQHILKGFNIESDHLLTKSEFYQAQIGCIFSEPIREQQIIANKKQFIDNINIKYGIDISHLNDECEAYAKSISRPIVFTEESVSSCINSFHKILVEGFNVTNLRKLYETLFTEVERSNKYSEWQSIRLIKEVLKKLCINVSATIDIEQTISPLYILNDWRIYLDHLLPNHEREDKKKHIVETLGGTCFTQQEELYYEEINRLNNLFQYLIILSK